MPMPINVEATITVGNILSAVTTIAVICVAAWRMTVKLSKMEMKLNMIWTWYKREHKIHDKD